MRSIRSIRDLAATARGRRLDRGLSQAELADRARLSRQWLSEFEAGKPTAEVALVLRLLDALELDVAVGERGAETDPAPRSGTAPVDLDNLLDEYDER